MPRVSTSTIIAASHRASSIIDVEVADRRTFGDISSTCRAHGAAARRPARYWGLISAFCCAALARARWSTYGVEINADAARYCREQRNLNVVSAALDAHTYAENSFDVVLMGDVIEHLRDPLALMRVVHTILKPGGAVIISTPDIAGWAGRLLQIKPEEHLYYFSPDTISRLLGQAGLELVGVKCLDRYHNLTAMTHSTTLGGVFQTLAPAFNLARRLFGDTVAKLPLRENLLAVARKPIVVV
ncbi:MAG: class I SAM-dependent methyltransferase [Kouleothrix sp.]